MLFRIKPDVEQNEECAIEDGFPFVEVSKIAQAESWRKEVFRPIYHIHKWWAQRLGSVFRAIILASALPKEADVMSLFYQPVNFPDLVVFDPFMGSGTTVGEAFKLGCKAIGRDINPVACFAVKNALSQVGRKQIYKAFKKIESTAGPEIRSLYSSTDSKGRPCDVLYYFWVKVLPCPHCKSPVDLFSRFIFASHAYSKKYKEARAVCPSCGEINLVNNDVHVHKCTGCGVSFNPNNGWAKRTTAICPSCGYEFKIAETSRKQGKPPEHRMYAKLVLTRDGEKEYLRVSEADLLSYKQASERLRQLQSPFPIVEIASGYNTDQVLNYGYKYWHQMFNNRQLLGLSILATSIQEIEDRPAREALACLFSGVLEFNNMFASYKGEGTGAVRHMFSHHILKPERTPIEANIWGTPKSSGAFSTLFRSRLLRAIDYKEKPFELAVKEENKKIKGVKVYGLSDPIRAEILDHFPEKGLKEGQIYLSCASSTDTDIPSKSVNLIITDPPFFDNVHYSELADFFYVWQHHLFDTESGPSSKVTTRSPDEVQATEIDTFTKNLGRVFQECHRVLKDNGLLVFTYHHSREEGWSSVARAVLDAGFKFVKAQPVKSEMSVAVPKSQSKHPIDLDIIMVCRKDLNGSLVKKSENTCFDEATEECRELNFRFNNDGRYLSQGDIKVILLAKLLIQLSQGRNAGELESRLQAAREKLERTIIRLYNEQFKIKSGETGVKTEIKNEDDKASETFPELGL